MQKTKIEWADYTWNPITGCLKGCDFCYARRIATRFAGGSAFPKGFEPTFHPERLSEHFPKKPSKIFTCSMGELFGDWLPAWQVEDVFATIRAYPQHTFQLLTKQPQNLIKFSPFPENVWVGCSVTDERSYAANLWHLIAVNAPVKFLSIEPLLGRIDPLLMQNTLPSIDWLIIGQQTPCNAKTMPHVTDIQEIIRAADNANIPVFLKNSIKGFIPFRQYFKGGDNWKDVYGLRQEFPLAPKPGVKE